VNWLQSKPIVWGVVKVIVKVNVGLNIGFPNPVFSRKTPVFFVRIGIIAIFANDRARNAPLWNSIYYEHFKTKQV
jgi:hypothetical protein